MKTKKNTALIEVALPSAKKSRAKRWVVTFVDRPIDDRDEFMTENEVWRQASRITRLLVEKVGPAK